MCPQFSVLIATGTVVVDPALELESSGLCFSDRIDPAFGFRRTCVPNGHEHWAAIRAAFALPSLKLNLSRVLQSQQSAIFRGSLSRSEAPIAIRRFTAVLLWRDPTNRNGRDGDNAGRFV
jgi:hypothetical protein